MLPTALGLGWAAALAGWLWPLLAGRRCLGWLAVAMAGWPQLPWLAGRGNGRHVQLQVIYVQLQVIYNNVPSNI